MIRSIKLLTLLSASLLSGCAILSLANIMEDKSPYGPWYGFIYEATARGEETRVYHGEFEALTNCMQLMQAKTKYSGYAYFCGYNCPGMPNVNASYTCEKLMGSPLTALD